MEKLTLDMIRYCSEAIHPEPQYWTALFKMFHIRALIKRPPWPIYFAAINSISQNFVALI